MPVSFRPYANDQVELCPVRPREWLEEGHLCFAINDLVEALPMSEFYKKYEGDGPVRWIQFF